MSTPPTLAITPTTTYPTPVGDTATLLVGVREDPAHVFVAVTPAPADPVAMLRRVLTSGAPFTPKAMPIFDWVTGHVLFGGEVTHDGTTVTLLRSTPAEAPTPTWTPADVLATVQAAVTAATTPEVSAAPEVPELP